MSVDEEDDATPPWRVKVWWAPVGGERGDPDEYDMVTTGQEFAEREPARKAALHLACCRGARGVVLYNPDGDVDGHYDRFSNVAVRLSGHVVAGVGTQTEGEIGDDHST